MVLLSEHMTFLNKASLNATFDSIPREAKVVIDKRRVVHMAEDIKDIIREFHQRAKIENIEISYVNKGRNTKNLSANGS